jgi:hypothetical protein
MADAKAKVAKVAKDAAKDAPKDAKGAKNAKGAAEAESATGKFAEFIAAKKLDTRRILAVSRQLESLQVEDRAIRLNKRKARSAAKEGGDNATKETRKPRSGRPVTNRALQAALHGGELSGPTKTRILRAVNHLLELKKQEKVEIRALF